MEIYGDKYKNKVLGRDMKVQKEYIPEEKKSKRITNKKIARNSAIYKIDKYDGSIVAIFNKKENAAEDAGRGKNRSQIYAFTEGIRKGQANSGRYIYRYEEQFDPEESIYFPGAKTPYLAVNGEQKLWFENITKVEEFTGMKKKSINNQFTRNKRFVYEGWEFGKQKKVGEGYGYKIWDGE